MPDQRASDSSPGSKGPAGAAPGRAADAPGAAPKPPFQQPRSERQIEQLLDVYTQLFQAANRDQSPSGGLAPPLRGSRLEGNPVPTAPVSPETLAQSGLSLMQVCDLILNQLYLQGAGLAGELARQSGLPSSVIEAVIVFLNEQQCIE